MLTQFVAQHKDDLRRIAYAIRSLSLDAVLKAKSGHIGLPMGCAELGALLYFGAMAHSPSAPTWPNRHRFVLSAGHGSAFLYALLHLSGYHIRDTDLQAFRQFGSITPGHPERDTEHGVECTTGPLGQGLGHAVGLALAEKMLARRFNTIPNEHVVNHLTWVLAGDGCLMEGVSYEACSLAGHWKLNKLIVIYDANNITIDGPTDSTLTEDIGARFRSQGWNTLHADGHDFLSLATALEQAKLFAALPEGATGPTLVIMKTCPGKGLARWEGKPKVHGNPITSEDVAQFKEQALSQEVDSMGRPLFGPYTGVPKPFSLPSLCVQSATQLSKLVSGPYEKWLSTLGNWKRSATADLVTLWESSFPEQGKPPKVFTLPETLWQQADKTQATRVSGGLALEALAEQDRRWVGGSADLAGSTQTTLGNSPFVHSTDFSGPNIAFGVREHAMAAITNGLTLHGGLRGYCSTFAVFSDYMRPSIRLAALMGLPAVFILTHDSFAVGEDGPTHQPIEHATSLRAIPHLAVLRPADTFETFCAWEWVSGLSKPAALLLTRQDVTNLDSLCQRFQFPIIRQRSIVRQSMESGAYAVKDFQNPCPTGVQKVTLVASGSEVAVCLEAAYLMETSGFQKGGELLTFSVRVVSAPAPDKLLEHPHVLATLIPEDVPTLAVEAGNPLSWGHIVGRRGQVMGLMRFGASAPQGDLAKILHFTPPDVVQKVCQFFNAIWTKPET